MPAQYEISICKNTNDKSYFIKNFTLQQNAFILQIKSQDSTKGFCQALLNDQDGIIIDKKVQRL